MKIILSRKGYDSSTGGCASPIFPDGSMYSIPISGVGSSRTYGDVQSSAGNVGQLLGQLPKSHFCASDPVHLDPDLDAMSIPRRKGWRAAFGQAGTAQSHLKNQNVDSGDIFLFYGWFSEVQRGRVGRWKRVPGARNVHVVFGWLQVDSIVDVEASGPHQILKEFPWLVDHPHLHVPDGEVWGRNVIYIARQWLNLGAGLTGRLPGAGLNRRLVESAVLTSPVSTRRSLWRLPAWFANPDGSMALSCNPNRSKCLCKDGYVYLQSVRSQEQVVDCRERSDARTWIGQVVGH